MTHLIDTHCHIAHIERPLADVLADAEAAGVEVVIDIGMGAEESAAAAARASGGNGLYAAVGYHPNDLSAYAADPTGAMEALRGFLAEPRVVGIGETGIDTYRDRTPVELQEDAFRAHIALAKDADRTLVIHCREAHDRVLAVLDESAPPSRVVMHCFSGDVRFAGECAERGFYCSFAGNITYARSDILREAARALPRNLLLVETDAPFLTPHPFRGKPNHPALIVHTATVLADVRSEPFEALVATLRNNTQRAFRIE